MNAIAHAFFRLAPNVVVYSPILKLAKSIMPNVIKNSDLSKHCKKLIVVGTPDKQGRLKKFVDTHPEFKVVYYPVTKCPELYPISRIASYETYVGKQNMDRELFAKLT